MVLVLETGSEKIKWKIKKFKFRTKSRKSHTNFGTIYFLILLSRIKWVLQQLLQKENWTRVEIYGIKSHIIIISWCFEHKTMFERWQQDRKWPLVLGMVDSFSHGKRFKVLKSLSHTLSNLSHLLCASPASYRCRCVSVWESALHLHVYCTFNYCFTALETKMWQQPFLNSHFPSPWPYSPYSAPVCSAAIWQTCAHDSTIIFKALSMFQSTWCFMGSSY